MAARIKHITFTSGDTLDASEGLNILVGPNNAGKSSTLSELYAQFSAYPGQELRPSKVVSSYEIQYPTLAEMENRLRAIAPLRPPGQYAQGIFDEPTYLSRQGVLPQSRVHALIQNSESGRLGELASLFIASFSPENRLGQLGAQQLPDLSNQEPSNPVQILWNNRDLERKVSEYARRAFGFDLTVNRHAGNTTRLHVGKPSAHEPLIGIRTEYLAELMALPEVGAQGHGVQAFLGIVLTLATGAFDIVLIDEPEAFLHPPQSRLLGEILVELSRDGSQVIVATHSDDFLQGALRAAGASTEVTLARLTRPISDFNTVAQISPPAVKKLYDDPLLRYSHVLSGIFYRGAILCESESDCNYYCAVLDTRFAAEDASTRRPDLLFAQCGGKDRFTRAVGALQSMKTPVAVIADIDMLRDKSKFKALFEKLGGDWTTISAGYTKLHAAIEAKTVSAERRTTRVAVEAVFDGSAESRLSRNEIEAIREATKAASGWSILKESGKAAVPSGEPTNNYIAIVNASKAVGLFLVEEGELEGWHREYARKNKQAWLRRVFEDRAYEQSTASPMLAEIVDFIASRQ